MDQEEDNTSEGIRWDDFAGGWDEDAGARAYAHAAFESLGRLCEERRVPLDGADVCDFGCGTGLLTEKLAPACDGVFAVDTSARMIEQLQRKVGRLGLTNVRTAATSLHDVMHHEAALVAGGFDLVVCSSVCAFLDDYPGTVSRLVGLLNPGGLFVQWDWELDAQAEDPHGLTRSQIAQALSASGLDSIRVETAFELQVGENTVRPLMGSGEKGGERHG